MERIMISSIVRSVTGFVLLDHFLRVHKLWRNGESKFEHGFVSSGRRFLRKKPDGRVLLDRDGSVIRRCLAENQ